MTIALRDYQLEVVSTVLCEERSGTHRQLISLPTGSGKTVIMSALAQTVNKRTLMLAHREELITQAVDKFKLFWPGVGIGVCMAERNEIDAQIVIGSVQTCSRPKRLDKLRDQGFDVMMIDEAHHAAADSYQDIINACGFGSGTNKLLVGVTATPVRSDKQHLGDTFDKITFSRSIGTMIRAGYLSPVVGRKILTSFILERIRTQNGDFAIDELAEVVNTPERNTFLVGKFLEYAKGRKTVAFCCNVGHCQDLAAVFNKAGIAAVAVWGDMHSDDRKQALDDLKKGRIQVAASCGVLCEGYDEPSITAVVMARPTRSAALYIQCIGRGLRLWPGKQDCLVLDFSDQGHSLDTIMSLSSAIPEATIFKEAKEAAEPIKEIDRRPKIEVFEEVDREFDILGSVRFMWVSVGDEWSLIDDERREIVMSPSAGGFIAVLYNPEGGVSRLIASSLPFEYCACICEDYARRNLKIAFSDLSALWLNSTAPPTQSQRDYLQKQSAWRDGLTKAEAAIEIRKIIAAKNRQRRQLSADPITDRQKYYLTSCGIETANMSKLQAMQAIAKLKQKVG